MNDTIQLTFAHLSILGTIGVLASAALALVVSRIVRAVGWKKPYSSRQKCVLEWAPALVFGVICIWLFPFVYSQVVGPAEDLMWHVVGFAMGIVGGLGSKGFYALARHKLAPAWKDGATKHLRD